jgi:hypothetical protein
LRVQERFDCWNRDEFEPMEQMYAEDTVFDVSAVFTEVEQRFAFLYTVRPEDGKVIRAQLLPDVAAAVSVAESSAPLTA